MKEEEMDRNELRAKLNNLPRERFIYSIIDDVAKAQRAAGFQDPAWFDFIEREILKYHEVAPKLSVVPPTKRIPMAPLLEDGWEWGHRGAFDHRDDPQKLIEFCSPYSAKRNKFFDELTEGQQNLSEMVYEDVSRAKARASKKQISEPNNIEDALDNAIKQRTRRRETGEDTP
jgi:hypothetical protein